MKLIDFIIENPWILLIVVSWLVSAFGGIMQRAAKKAAEQQQKAARKADGGSADAPDQIDPAVAARRVEEVLERRREVEQRRLEQARARQERQAVRRVEAQATRSGVPTGGSSPRGPVASPIPTPPPMPVEVVKDRRTTLSEELALKEAERRRRTAAQDLARDAHLGDNVRGRHLEIHAADGRVASRAEAPSSGTARGRSSAMRSLVNLDRPARAFISMEVFGAPVGMRDRPIGRPYH
ncbi:MAG: hypothetical protein AAF196_18795 [Planctomycetota bacterium]